MDIKSAIAARLNAQAQFWHRLWTIRLALFWMAANGVVGSLDFFAGTELVSAHPLTFAVANTIGGVVIGVARILKQPGIS